MAASNRAAPPILLPEDFLPKYIFLPKLSPFIPHIPREWERAAQRSFAPRFKGKSVFKRYPLKPCGYGYTCRSSPILRLHPIYMRPAWITPAIWRSTSRIRSEDGNVGIKRRCIARPHLHARYEEVPELMDIDVQWENLMDFENSARPAVNIFPSTIMIGARMNTSKRTFDSANIFDTLIQPLEVPAHTSDSLVQSLNILGQLETTEPTPETLVQAVEAAPQVPEAFAQTAKVAPHTLETPVQSLEVIEESLGACAQLLATSEATVVPIGDTLAPCADAEVVDQVALAPQKTLEPSGEALGKVEEISKTCEESLVLDAELNGLGHGTPNTREDLRDIGKSQESLQETLKVSVQPPVRTRRYQLDEDDAKMIRNFIIRAHAKKKAAGVTENGPKSATVYGDGGDASSRKALTELDHNSPSPQKNDASGPGLTQGDIKAGEPVKDPGHKSNDSPRPIRKLHSASHRPGTPPKKTRLHRKLDPNNPFLSFQPRMNVDVLRALSLEDMAALAAANTQRNTGIKIEPEKIEIDEGPWEKGEAKPKSVAWAKQLTHVRPFKQSWAIRETVYTKGEIRDRLHDLDRSKKVMKPDSGKKDTAKQEGQSKAGQHAGSAMVTASHQRTPGQIKSDTPVPSEKRAPVFAIDPRLLAEDLNPSPKTETKSDTPEIDASKTDSGQAASTGSNITADVNTKSERSKIDLKLLAVTEPSTKPEGKGSSMVQTKLKDRKLTLKFVTSSDFATRPRRQPGAKADGPEVPLSPTKIKYVSMSEVSSRVTRNSARKLEAKDVLSTKIPPVSAGVSKIPSRRGATKTPLRKPASTGSDAAPGRKLRSDRG